MKRCTKCEKDKDESEFYKNDVYNTPDGLSWSCKECISRKSIESYENRKTNGLIDTKRKRSYDRQKRYNLTEEELYELLQQKTCQICGGDNNDKVLHIDHDHVTGKVRGMLCINCNMGLGIFKDNEALLLECVAYLKKSRK